jgi:RNA polymerase sigma-32 factor
MAAEYLDAETEAALARAWRNEGDEAALHRLVKAYTRLAVSVAAKYRQFGTPFNDLVQEAGVGLLKAANKFDPDLGFRFSTYAFWWIKAAIQDYVMRNFSLVRVGSTTGQKALFFRMRRMQTKIETEMRAKGRDVNLDDIYGEIARELSVPIRDVVMMGARLGGIDFSLNATKCGESGGEWVEALEDEGLQAEELVANQSDIDRARAWVDEAFEVLTSREKEIVRLRRLADDPDTLARLALKLKLSKERVRQLECRALKKMRQRLKELHPKEVAEIPAFA